MLKLGIANFPALQMIKNHPDNHELNSRHSKTSFCFENYFVFF